MSGLNASLGYFVAVVVFAATGRTLLKKWPRFSFISEFASSFMLVACWLEVQTIVERRSALIQVPLIAVLLTFLSYTARGYTSAYINPSLAYGLTFHCPGFTFMEYAVVYWLGPLTGVTLALLLYMGHIPRIFAKNLLYFQKTRFRVPKGEKAEKKKL
ncbi:aquaporin 12 isoform X2 [Parambassis ranga]|uniref:Aquaporin 12 isoform X2 n=1 Tax=Parambassis ranga TaxID=210632 RepID=A0A6P7HTA5_9TELE|nr:aquaporin-12-like isoform X2 [Parambassis ranga]